MSIYSASLDFIINNKPYFNNKGAASVHSLDYPANKPRQDYILNVGTKKLYPKQNMKR